MGNRSLGDGVQGVRRTLVRLRGALVSADLCLPRTHGHAIWLLPWVERLLSGGDTPGLGAPPWPQPPDPLLARRLMHTLLDLRWARPDWTNGGVAVAPALLDAWRSGGRRGLAKLLFDVQVLPGEWWADGLGGALLGRHVAGAFDWDHRRAADVILEGTGDVQALVDTGEPDVRDLVRKLGGVEAVNGDPNQAFLGTPLRIGDRRDILFPLFGDELRLMPDELGELEPVLAEHAPELFGQRKTARPRIVRMPRSPVDALVAELERLPSNPTALGPRDQVLARVQRLVALADEKADELARWLDTSELARPVAGPTQRHFDALAEVAAGLDGHTAPILLLSTAFLNEANVAAPGGLAESLALVPDRARMLVIYGHASDDLPAQQQKDVAGWTSALLERSPGLRGRLIVVAGRYRSHEKVLLSSRGDWLVGSWNAGSSRPGATVFECSLLGRSPAFAAKLLEKLAENVEGDEAVRIVADLRRSLERAPAEPREVSQTTVARLRDALGLLAEVVPDADGGRADAWEASVRAARAALQPLRVAAHFDLVDQHQTRDAFAVMVASARGDVLLASDRLADSALDGATLRDLRGDGRARRMVRVVWGREWAGRRPSDSASRDQLQRARRTLREARDQLGDRLLTREEPMENHAKGMIIDGLRGAVTSENLLSYGGEKGRRESRELGLLFWSPVLARDLLGRFLRQWPDLDAPPLGPSGPPLGWAATTNELWHSLNALSDELDFDWSAPSYLCAALREELDAEAETAELRRAAWEALTRRAGPAPVAWVRDEAERLGLVHPDPGGSWRPWDAPAAVSVDALLQEAQRARDALPPASAIAVTTARDAKGGVHPLVARVIAELVPIPAGTFLMGDDRVAQERPRHRVRLTRPFSLGRTPVTQGLWEAVMGRLPHLRDVERNPDFPIILVSYDEMGSFFQRLNTLPGGGGFSLPTEAQWEYACRAGSDRVYCFGDDPGSGNQAGLLEQYAWTKRNANARTQRVGLLKPNRFGLYDMHGLVYETMLDGFRTYEAREAVDPVGPIGAGRIVARGGSWGRFPFDPRNPVQEHFRCASRQVYEKSQRVSFRICRDLGEP